MPGLLGVSSVLSIQNLRKKTAESRSWGVGLDRALRRFLSFSTSYSHQFIRFFYQFLAYFLQLFRTLQQALRSYSLSMPLRFRGVHRFLDHWGHIAFPDAVYGGHAQALFSHLFLPLPSGLRDGISSEDLLIYTHLAIVSGIFVPYLVVRVTQNYVSDSNSANQDVKARTATAGR